MFIKLHSADPMNYHTCRYVQTTLIREMVRKNHPLNKKDYTLIQFCDSHESMFIEEPEEIIRACQPG